MKTALRLLSIGLLTATTGCFGWAENTLDEFQDLRKNPPEAEAVSTSALHTARTVGAGALVPVVGITEGVVSVAAIAGLILISPILIFTFPTC